MVWGSSGEGFVHGPVVTFQGCMGIDVDRCADRCHDILYRDLFSVQFVSFVLKMMHTALRYK